MTLDFLRHAGKGLFLEYAEIQIRGPAVLGSMPSCEDENYKSIYINYIVLDLNIFGLLIFQP